VLQTWLKTVGYGQSNTDVSYIAAVLGSDGDEYEDDSSGMSRRIVWWILPVFRKSLLPTSSGLSSSETSINNLPTSLRNNPEDSHLNLVSCVYAR
jgi:hypothetical protein